MKTIFLQFTEQVTDQEFLAITDQLKDVDPDLKVFILHHNIEPKVYTEPLTKLEEFAKSVMGAIILKWDTNDMDIKDSLPNYFDVIACDAFDQAESMLKEAEKRQS